MEGKDTGTRQEREIAYVKRAVESFENEEFALWQARPVTTKIGISKGTILVLWQMRADLRPEVIDAFEVKDVRIDWYRGLGIWIQSCRFSKLDYCITHIPSLIAGHPEVFAWLPFNSEVRHQPHPGGIGWTTRTALCTRTKTDPREPVAGDTYLTLVGEFRARFREFAEVRF